MARRKLFGARFAAPILIISTCFLFGSSALRAQNGGYMRAMTSHGQVAGESTDAKYNGWIIVRQATLPSASEIVAMAEETTAAGANAGTGAVHKPVVIVKARDRSSLALLGAMTSKQHFPEIDIVVTSAGNAPIARYKLTDATVIAIRAGATDDAQEPVEQVRLGYAKIEIE